MATLTIRRIEQKTLEDLRKRAQEHDRSLEAEVREILGAQASRDKRIKAARLAAAWVKQHVRGRQSNSAALVRNIRDEA